MAESGAFVTLFDSKTVVLYLARGVYGTLMRPYYPDQPLSRAHYPTLADYACTRGGTHIFFFLKRRIVYGGQAIGPADHGAFYLNGPFSPMGKAAQAPVAWDESTRACYNPSDLAGIFTIPTRPDRGCQTQPYLLRFEDRLGLRGRCIASDDLYWKLGDFPYPLPSNSIQGMSFCTLTPAETTTCLDLMRQSERVEAIECDEATTLVQEPIPFRTEHGFHDLAAAFRDGLIPSEASLEAAVLANPRLLPNDAQPPASAALCRQVPICPFKPFQMDRADICYFSDDAIRSGSLPNTIIELKRDRATQSAILQAERYLDWIHRVAAAEARSIRVLVVAPDFSSRARPTRYCDQIIRIQIR